MAPAVEYFYDSNGFWRCGDSRWRQWRHRGAAWRGGTIEGWRVWRRDGGDDNEGQRELVKKMNENMAKLEKRIDEVDELQKRVLQKLEEEGCWRWWIDWRIMNAETMTEQKEQLKCNDEQGKANQGRVDEVLVLLANVAQTIVKEAMFKLGEKLDEIVQLPQKKPRIHVPVPALKRRRRNERKCFAEGGLMRRMSRMVGATTARM
eukprot:TRINITY_DN25348_c0_g2_i1.p1 TRINITY_DN25348_c0_g2~~TRINITY_DN25348_c0_g2_i1.p1  ORF type:complete len:205 (+),score=58.98 TRINITY_DN25348_c0_g2_i1:81-695(+)